MSERDRLTTEMLLQAIKAWAKADRWCTDVWNSDDPGKNSREQDRLSRTARERAEMRLRELALAATPPAPAEAPLDVAGTLAIVRATLEREGIDEPERGIHSWRCAHPDRYGKCKCLDAVMEDIAAALAQQAEPLAEPRP